MSRSPSTVRSTSATAWMRGAVLVIAACLLAGLALRERNPLLAGAVLVIFGLLQGLLRARMAARRFSETDSLTGLLNRGAFLGRLQQEADRCRRLDHPLVVLFLDGDDFKSFNDSQGHMAGDEALQLIGEALTRATRSYDVVARMGGDEFAVLFPELAGAEAESIGSRLHNELREQLQSRGLSLSVSIGMAAFDHPPASARDMIAAADGQMYIAKNRGGDALAVAVDAALPHASADDTLRA